MFQRIFSSKKGGSVFGESGSGESGMAISYLGEEGYRGERMNSGYQKRIQVHLQTKCETTANRDHYCFLMYVTRLQISQLTE